MNFMQLLLILKARFWLALLVLIATVGITLAVSFMLPKKYMASTSMLVDVRSPDPISAIIDRGVILPPNLTTQIDVIKSDRVARKVVAALRLDQNPVVRQQWIEATGGRGRLDVWLAELLQKRLSVKPSRDSMIITIEYEGADPSFAAAVANAFAQAYIDVNIELKVEPARQYAGWFAQQSKLLRENLEKTQTTLSAYQQEKGIVARDEQLDAETAKLNDLTAQLTVVQAQTADAQSKQRSGSAASALPEVAQHPLITGLKADIARQEAGLQQIGGELGRNHPSYQRLATQIAALKQQLEIETRHITSGFSASRGVGKDKEAELRAAIEAQKLKLLQIKSERDELAVLQRDVDAAKKTYEAVAARFTQASLESQATQTNVSVLTPAVAPIEPSSPNILRFTFAAILIGTLLGAAAAYVLEMADRRIRSVEDLAAMLQLPVLGVIERAGSRRRLPFRRDSTALLTR
jgi:polysaccharide biosynthesis transport protein